MLKAFKYKLKLNKEQQNYFNNCFGCVRLVYNLGLSCKIQAYQSLKTNLSFYDLNKQLTDLKKDYEFLKEPGKDCLQNALINLDQAYSGFFKGKGFPKYKNKHTNNSAKFNQSISITEGKIKLPKIGLINYYGDREIKGTIKSITVSKNTLGMYFASVLVDTEIPKLVKIDKEIGIDLGIKHFITDSDSTKIDNPKYLIQSQKLLAKHQSRLSRKVKRSNRYNRQKEKVAKVHYKITNQRKDFLHKLSSKLINENQVIYLEDLNVAGMIKNHKLSKSISDASWSEFVRQLFYKSIWYGRDIIQIGRFEPTSKKCNVCSYINHELSLKDREWLCICGVLHDRDINAAINIKKTGQGMSKEDVELLPVGRAKKRQLYKVKVVALTNT